MNRLSIPRFVAVVVVLAAMMVVSVAGVAFADEGGTPNERASAVAQCATNLAHIDPDPGPESETSANMWHQEARSRVAP